MTYDIKMLDDFDESLNGVGCFHCRQPLQSNLPTLKVLRFRDGDLIDEFFYHEECAAYRLTQEEGRLIR